MGSDGRKATHSACGDLAPAKEIDTRDKRATFKPLPRYRRARSARDIGFTQRAAAIGWGLDQRRPPRQQKG